MVKDEKDVVREQQLPGSKFGLGSITLFQIAESHGKKMGHAQSIPSDAIVEDKNKEILAKAIPADKIENILQGGKRKTIVKAVQSNPIQIKRGMVMKHKSSRHRVTILEANVDTTEKGDIRHRVCIVGSKFKFLVPEKALEIING